MVLVDRANDAETSQGSPTEADKMTLPETRTTSIFTSLEDDRSCKMAAHAGVCRD
jgi:hypothetical protein